MILIFKFIVLTSLLVLGFKIATQSGMIGQKLGVWFEEKSKTNKLFELGFCQWCMGSIFSFPALFIAFEIGIIKSITWDLLWYYPINVAGTSLTCGLIWTAYLTLNAKKEYYENGQKNFYLLNKKLKKENLDG